MGEPITRDYGKAIISLSDTDIQRATITFGDGQEILTGLQKQPDHAAFMVWCEHTVDKIRGIKQALHGAKERQTSANSMVSNLESDLEDAIQKAAKDA